ncbi:MAG TPA: phosphoribosylglycinamide formyltransferase [Solirubrobacteraceae bacterium]|nr:phosphoribosylglycinamide formyltransferase [Solirubrobacteraceae bacterium]
MVALRLAILSSHAGTTARAVIDALADGRIEGSAVLLVCNNPDAEVLARAAAAGVPTVVLNGRTHPDPADLDRAILAAARAAGATHILLAGYMKKLGPATVAAYAGRVFNSHPALLPAFGGQGMYGDRVHAAVLAAGVARSGATVHLVTDDYDAGSIVAQAEVPVLPGDDVAALGERVRAAERELLVVTLAEVAQRAG